MQENYVYGSQAHRLTGSPSSLELGVCVTLTAHADTAHTHTVPIWDWVFPVTVWCAVASYLLALSWMISCRHFPQCQLELAQAALGRGTHGGSQAIFWLLRIEATDISLVSNLIPDELKPKPAVHQ